MRTLVACTLAIALGVAATAAASSEDGTYTGCVQRGTGRPYALAPGGEPMGPCHENDHEIRLGSGAVASILGESGIVVTTSGAEVRIGLDHALLDARYANRGAFEAHDHDDRYPLSGQSCPPGELVTGIAADGALLCADPLSSPSGNHRITIDDTDGIRLVGPNAGLTVRNGDIEGVAFDMLLESVTQFVVRAGATFDLNATGAARLDGAVVELNGSCAPVARRGDGVATDPSGTGSITGGSAFVRAC